MLSTDMTSQRRQTRVLWIIFGTLVLDMIGTGMVFPIIPILFTDPSSPSFILEGYSRSAQFATAGLVTALFGLMQFIAAPILGELSDFYGRKKLLLTGVGVLAASQALFGFGIITSSLATILIARMTAGLAGANISIAQATIADVTEPKDRAKNLGIVGAALGIGFILGPALSGWIANAAGDAAAPFWFASILGSVNLLFVWVFLAETRTAEAELRRRFTFFKGVYNLRDAFINRDVRGVYLASFLYVAGFAFIPAFGGVLLVAKYGMAEAGIGIFFAIVGAWVVATQLVFLRWLTKRYSEKPILRLSLGVLALGIALFPFFPSALAMYLFIPIVAVPQGLSMANMQALVSRSVSAENQGVALGINSSLLAFSTGVIPLIAGFTSGLIGVELPFLVGGALVTLSWLVLFVWAQG